MTRKNRVINHLLLCLMEECAEVSIEASKAQRFGRRTFHKTQVLSPEQRLDYELNDIYAIVELLADLGVNLKESSVKKAAKKAKLKRTMTYSRAQSML